MLQTGARHSMRGRVSFRLAVAVLLGFVVAAVSAWFHLRNEPDEHGRLAVPDTTVEAPGAAASRSRQLAFDTSPINSRPFEEEPQSSSRPEPHAGAHGAGATVAPSPPASAVTGRLVAEDGHLLSGAAAVMIERRGGRVPSGEQPTTMELDDASRFRFVLAPEDLPTKAIRHLVIHVVLRGTDAAAKVRAVMVEVPRTSAGGDTEIGDVFVPPAPLLARGKVSDRDGAPVVGARASMRARRWRSRSDRDDVGETLAPEGQTDDTGTFEIHGLVEFGTPRDVLVEKFGFRSAAQALGPKSAREIEIVLERAGSFQGTILLDQDLPRDRIVVECLPRSTAAVARSKPQRTGIDAAGMFGFSGIETDSVSIVVRATGVADPLIQADGIGIRPGPTTTDPRLSPLDLRGFLRGITVTVCTSDGKPARASITRLTPGGPPGGHTVHAGSDGKALFLVTTSSVDLRVDAGGFMTQRLDDVFADRTVTLRRASRARFQLEGDRPDVPPNLDAFLMVTSLEADRVQYRIPLSDQWKSGVVTFPEPGGFEAAIRLDKRLDGGATETASVALEQKITIADEDDVQDIALRADDALTSKLAALTHDTGPASRRAR